MIRSNVDMMEALRLTRQGRLGEAMAVLRGASPAGEGDGGARWQAKTSGPSVVDMVPPSGEAGSAWTAPPAGAAPPSMPGVLLDRLSRFGTPVDLDGVAGRTIQAKVRPPAGATFEDYSFTNEAGSRRYKLYVPSGYKGQALPLVVMLHGCTQSPDDFAAGTRMNEVAEEHNFLVAYPAQARSANVSKCWNWFEESEQHRGRGEPSLIAGITRQIMRDFPVETGRVYVAGLSAGGAAAAIMGATYPDLYAAIGVHSGLACGAARDMPSAFAAMRQGGGAAAGSGHGGGAPVPTIVFHGDCDKTVHPVNGDQIIAQANAATALEATVVRGKSLSGMSFIRTIHADDTGRSVLEQWVLQGAGHAWSGGSAGGSYTEPRGPDATREMVRFFLEHSTRMRGR
jgi:poly(hydroxyalkanoate) depolymerase family esterase